MRAICRAYSLIIIIGLKRFLFPGFVVGLCIVASCDKGLAPPPAAVVTSISGRVSFSGTWPRRDSVRALELVLVQPSAPFADSTLIQGLNTTVIPLVALNYNSSDTAYRYIGIKPDTYHYLGVAQLFDTNVFRDWRVVGFAHDANDSARAFVLHAGDAITGADVHVNWDSLPRQPFLK